MTSGSGRAKTTELYLASLNHLEEQGDWEMEDYHYVLRCYTLRPVKLAEAEPHANPHEWMLAIQSAEQEEQQYFKSLTEHGFPDTEGMDWREAHTARLQHLMRKYPKADWKILNRGQFDGHDRVPMERKVVPQTIQHMERVKTRYINNFQQLTELITHGQVDGEWIGHWKHELKRQESKLVGYGYDIDVIKQGNPDFFLPIDLTPPLSGSEVERLRSRVDELNELLDEMESVEDSAFSDITLENALLEPTKKVLDTYRAVLESVGYPESTSVETAEHELPTVMDAAATVGERELQGTKPVAKDDLLDARQASDYLGIAYSTMLQELNSGRFPFASKLGNRWKVHRPSLDDWIRGHRDDVESLKTPPRQTRKAVVEDNPAARGNVLTSKAAKSNRPQHTRPDGTIIKF